MDQKRAGEPHVEMDSHLREIRHLLSNLHGEVTVLEESYTQVLQVLRTISGVANVDDLTGLLRRRPFFQKWEALLDECQRLNQMSGVLMIDIDHFKRVNDTHGHATGDEVIRNVASLLKQFSSPDCIVSRVGGEEFAVAVRGTENEISGVAELIRKGTERLASGASHKNEVVKCTVSVGVAIDDTDVLESGSSRPACVGNSRIAHRTDLEEKATALLSRADEALYEAKKEGRNRVIVAQKEASENKAA